MDFMDRDSSPLCCCEYIDIKKERNHILTCCCNCPELDSCCERLITCKKVTKREVSNVIMICLDRIRCPWRGGAFPFTAEMLLSTILQPIIAFILASYFSNLTLYTSLLVIAYVVLCFNFTKRNSRSHILYYWMASSITYSFILFQSIIVPLAEIQVIENFFLIIFTIVSLYFFYLTKTYLSNNNNAVEYQNGELVGNGVANESICPVCRIKVYPRNYHCHICQNCIPTYDYHCFWLNCCIGGANHSFFMVGLLFGALSLGYASLLILTTICQPVFKFGVLLPDDCTEISGNTEASISFICGVYCMELAFLLLFRLLHHVWLISRGFSALEWGEQFGYSLCQTSPFNRGCISNWSYLLKSFSLQAWKVVSKKNDRIP